MPLNERPVRSIVRAAADAATRWCDADFPPRVRAAARVCERTGYSMPVVEYALDRLFESLTLPAIASTIADELGSLDALDGFVARDGRPRARAHGIGPVAILSSRTTIGVAIVPAVFALCAKCTVTVKDREDALAAAFFATVAEELGDAADAPKARAWESARVSEPLDGYACVVAFGSDETLAHLRATLPLSTTFIGFGPKASIGYVDRTALSDRARAERVAADAARDLVLYESEGCLSLHALFVERGGSIPPDTFAELLARAVERASVEFPPAARDDSDAVKISAARDLALFRQAGGSSTAHSDARAGFLLTVDPPADEPPAFLPRALAVRAVDGPHQVAAYVARHRLPIEALATSSHRAAYLELAAGIGASRVAPLGTLQSPPLGANHGGRPRIAEFVRWIDDET
jgi:hypothetical protein